MQILRCGRGGCRVGMIVRADGALYVVEHFTRQMVDGTGVECPANNCGYVMKIHARPATDAEIADYEREQAAHRERMAAYEAKVLERRAAYLERRAAGADGHGTGGQFVQQ